MKQLDVPYLKLPGNSDQLSESSELLDALSPEKIDVVPWPGHPYQPEVSFAVAHNVEAIFLKYYVSEKETKTVYTEINDPVYRDSCVEFFISLDQGITYYNLEFNSNGVCLAGYGSGRENRKLLPATIIARIESSTHRNPTPDGCYWELSLKVPASVFCFHDLQDLTGKTLWGNFYKCGDDLADPHFVAWNTITSEEPDFHLPEYFGKLTFSST